MPLSFKFLEELLVLSLRSLCPVKISVLNFFHISPYHDKATDRLLVQVLTYSSKNVVMSVKIGGHILESMTLSPVLGICRHFQL